MKELKEILNESIFDMDDNDLDIAKSDLWDIYNSKTKEEFIERCEYLSLRLKNMAKLAPYDAMGYLIRKTHTRYISILAWAHDNTITGVAFGPDKNAYRMIWNSRSNSVLCERSKIMDFTNTRIDPRESSKFANFPVFLLPKELVPSYTKLTRWIR